MRYKIGNEVRVKKIGGLRGHKFLIAEVTPPQKKGQRTHYGLQIPGLNHLYHVISDYIEKA